MSMIHLLTLKEDTFGLAGVVSQAFSAAKKKRLGDIDSVIRDVGTLTGAVLRKTKPVWSLL
jgi:hypothetical protein